MIVSLKILPGSPIIGKTLKQLEKEYSITISKITLYEEKLVRATDTKTEPELVVPEKCYIQSEGSFENIRKFNLDCVKFQK
jgi:Trk K+ transport system NAD-binding subunit